MNASAGSPRRRLLVDVTPLRTSRQFRLLYAGQVVSYLGTQAAMVAAPVQVWELTGSSFAVGLLGLVQFPLLMVGSVVGGSLADAHDRRRLLLVAQVLMGATSAGLALNAMAPHPQLWLVYALTGLSAAFSGLDFPTRTASVPELVERPQLPAALALNQLGWQLGSIVGPAAAGVLIARVSLAGAYWVDAASFGAAIVAMVLMRPMVPEGGGTRAGAGSVLEGLRFLKGKQAVQGTFVVDLNAMIFGLPRALFPALAAEVFGGGAATVGWLTAAPAVGAFLGALGSGWLGHVDGQGRAVIWAVVAWGAAIAVFGLVDWLPLALLLLAVAGFADVVSAVFRGTILQLSVPDRLRGRMSGVHILVVTGGPRLGDVEAGAVAALAGTSFAVVSGGLACVAGALAVARWLPALPHWRLRDHARAAPEGGSSARPA